MVLEKRLQFRAHPQVEITLSCAKEIGSVLLAPAEFKRALSNVINNGVEALEGKGTVQVRANRSSEHIEIVIQDNGKGIPVSILQRMREGETFTHGKSGGHGLGLQQTREALKACGGTLVIDSKLGFGTSVTFRLRSN